MRALYDVIVDGVTAREQPMIFETTTAGTVREGLYDDLYQEAENVINGFYDDNGYKNDTSCPSSTNWTAARNGQTKAAGPRQTPA